MVQRAGRRRQHRARRARVHALRQFGHHQARERRVRVGDRRFRLVEHRLVAGLLRLEVVQLRQRGEGVGQRRRARRGRTLRAARRTSRPLRAAGSRPDAARAAPGTRRRGTCRCRCRRASPGDDVRPRPVGAQPELRRLVRLEKRVVGQERLDLLADPLGDGAVVVEQREPAERPHAGGRTGVARQLVQRAGRHPLIDRRERVPLQVVRRAVQPRRDHLARGQRRGVVRCRRRGAGVRVGVDVQEAHVRHALGRPVPGGDHPLQLLRDPVPGVTRVRRRGRGTARRRRTSRAARCPDSPSARSGRRPAG